MRKLTTVMSKNQKLHSMNVPSSPELTKKVNLQNELQKQTYRIERAQKLKFIEENLPVLEAIQEAREVRVYLESEQDANSFVEEATKLKLRQKQSLGLEQLEEIQQDYGENHPVIPSKRQVSALALSKSQSML